MANWRINYGLCDDSICFTDAAEQSLKNDVCGDFNKIERCDRALIEGPTTLLTLKHVITQVVFR